MHAPAMDTVISNANARKVATYKSRRQPTMVALPFFRPASHLSLWPS